MDKALAAMTSEQACLNCGWGKELPDGLRCNWFPSRRLKMAKSYDWVNHGYVKKIHTDCLTWKPKTEGDEHKTHT